MQIVRIEKKNLVEEVYAQMYNMILSGTWREGEKLPSENLLANQFNVSRVVVREALQILRTQKYVITRHGSGSYISNPHNYVMTEESKDGAIRLREKDFHQMVEFRNCVEVRALELGIKNATEADIERLRSAVQGMKSSMDDLVRYSEADFEFHYALARSSHNEFFIQAMDGCRDKLFGCFYEMNKLKDCRPWGWQSHERVVNFIEQRNLKGAIGALQNIGEYNELRYADFFIKED